MSELSLSSDSFSGDLINVCGGEPFVRPLDRFIDKNPHRHLQMEIKRTKVLVREYFYGCKEEKAIKEGV